MRAEDVANSLIDVFVRGEIARRTFRQLERLG
jgi:hypothetical protein